MLLWITLPVTASAQPSNWQNLDLHKDSIFGISTEKAYTELLKGKKSNEVIVAVIDSGIDSLHEDLRSVLWTNVGEIPGNGIDDDHNGYIDDVHGWNFTGLPLSRDSLADLVKNKKAFYDSLSYTAVPVSYQEGYQRFRKVWSRYDDLSSKLQVLLSQVVEASELLDQMDVAIGTDNPTINQIRKFREQDSTYKALLDAVMVQMPAYSSFKAFREQSIDQVIERLKFAVDHLVSDSDSAGIAAGFIENNSDISYDHIFMLSPFEEVFRSQPLTFHGTHIAGIIAALRNNEIGINGIADNVKIMPIKIYSALYPQLTDEKLAAAIFYAVDNGARVISLSLGQFASPSKIEVDKAVRYAMEHNVLIVHAAGNNGMNLDEADTFYPNKIYADGRTADAWIDVGASGWRDDSTLAAPFSNYSKVYVDVFAPGVRVNSTTPGNGYMNFNGTSMATPVVAGLAALIMEYYPKLSASQIRDIIVKSVIKVDHTVIVPGHNKVPIVKPFSALCVSGGIVNAYNALKVAATYR